MPSFGVAQSGGNANPSLNIAAVFPGDQYYLFNAEAPAPPQASVVIERGKSPSGADSGITFLIEFSTAPTDSLQILGSNDPTALNAFNINQWQSLYTSSNKQVDAYTDTGRYRYYCAYLASLTPGPTVTVIAQR